MSHPHEFCSAGLSITEKKDADGIFTNAYLTK